MTSNGTGPVTAGELKERRGQVRLVTCPSGRSYRIRTIPNDELVGIMGAVPAVGDIPLNEREAAHAMRKMERQMAREPKILLARLESIVAAGLVDPKVGPGDDEILISDVPYMDLQFIAGELYEIGGLTKAAGEKLRPFYEDAIS